MSNIKSTGSIIEASLGKTLWKEGFRYRKNDSRFFGKPDFVLVKYKTVIFVDSCFWHGCKKHMRIPTTRRSYWKEKILRNIERDKEVTRFYKKSGWKIFRVWEHDLKKKGFVFDSKEIKVRF